MDPGFAEMDEPENTAARLEAWDRYTERLFTEESPILAAARGPGVTLEELRQTYETLSDNEDVDAGDRSRRNRPPDFSAERAAVVDDFLGRRRARPAGRDAHRAAGPTTRRPCGAPRGSRPPSTPPTRPRFARLAEVARDGAKKTGNEARAACGPSSRRSCRDTLAPGLPRWREYLHPILMRVVAPAAQDYAAWRRRSGRLNFQDLLLLARDLLRDHPAVRRAFQERFLPILVDEFQDTDPIQAEILLYLTGGDTSRRRTGASCRRGPGSLFVVGDPKQSIYRFRRADIETYGAVRSAHRARAAGCCT